jgi:hypothetical protein
MISSFEVVIFIRSMALRVKTYNEEMY